MANADDLKHFLAGDKAWSDWVLQSSARNPDWRADFSGVHLDGADIKNPGRAYHFERFNLSEADFRGAGLRNIDFFDCAFIGARFEGAILDNCRLLTSGFSNCQFEDTLLSRCLFEGGLTTGANFSRARVHFSTFRAVVMLRSDFSNARLYDDVFSNCNLRGSLWAKADIPELVFARCDLAGARGLDEANAEIVSIDTETIVSSWDHLPNNVLKAAGLTDLWLDYLPSLVAAADPLLLESVFISYSTRDGTFAERLYHDLKSKGVRTWLFPEDATWGRPVWDEIDTGIKGFDRTLAVLSENYLNSSPCVRELERSLQREDREKRNVLFPIRIDDEVFTWQHGRAADVTSLVIGDFRPAETDYDDSLSRLLKALQKR